MRESELAKSADPFDRLEWATYSIEQRQRYNDHNRIALLSVHGLMGLVIGIALAVDGPALAMKAVVGTHPAYLDLLQISPLAGGVTLLWGLAANRTLWLEALGMSIMLAWDLAMMFVVGIAQWVFGHDGDSVTVSTTYPIGVYGGLAALMAVHVLTLLLLIRERRRGRL